MAREFKSLVGGGGGGMTGVPSKVYLCSLLAMSGIPLLYAEFLDVGVDFSHVWDTSPISSHAEF